MAEQVLRRARVGFELVDGGARSCVVRRRPLLAVVDGFATAGECAHVLALGTEVEDGARELPGATRGPAGFAVELPVAGDAVLESLRSRIESAVGVVNEQPDTVRFRRYRAGESHPVHVDVYEIGGASLVATAMLCLTTPAAGGRTRFPLATPPVEVAPVSGRLVLWLDVLRDGTPDRMAVHDAAPVIAGEKVTATTFVYARPPAQRELVDGFPRLAS